MIKRTAGYMSLLLALVLTSAVIADDRDDRGRHDDGRYDRGRYDDRNGRYDSSELRQLASQLESLTQATYREARDDFRGTYGGRYRGSRDQYGRTNEALADLNRLDHRARVFVREINRARSDRRGSERQFHALDDAFRNASSSLSTVRLERDVRRLWSRVDHTMDELDDFYGGSRYGYRRDRD